MLASVPRECRAEPTPLVWHAPQRVEREVWYGWQLAIADGATLAVATTVGLRTKNVGDGLAVAAIGFLGPPVLIHALNDPDVGIPRYLTTRWGGAAVGALVPLCLAVADPAAVDLKAWHVGLGAGLGALVGTGVDIALATKTQTVTIGARPLRFAVAPFGLGIRVAGAF